MPELDRDTARDWIERWDRQQEESLPDREDRFTALIDAVEAGTERPDPLVLDIGCGPGSLAVRLLARLPHATVIGIDADPVSLTLGRAAYQDVPGLRFADLDLRVPGGHPASWNAWWEAAAADPVLASHVAERSRRHVGHHDTQSTQLATHIDALSVAGFAEVGTLWQRGDNRLLCGVLPAEPAP